MKLNIEGKYKHSRRALATPKNTRNPLCEIKSTKFVLRIFEKKRKEFVASKKWV
jgi:hypothetical protein